ncbi:hypothetical protein AGMMS49975_14400 [Clostridia bacterium]|nr:hypothetical protein AGMMS49975_14400 [Clostridia bacterium]
MAEQNVQWVYGETIPELGEGILAVLKNDGSLIYRGKTVSTDCVWVIHDIRPFRFMTSKGELYKVTLDYRGRLEINLIAENVKIPN